MTDNPRREPSESEEQLILAGQRGEEQALETFFGRS